MPSIISPPAGPVGNIKTFGAFGPKYELGEPMGQPDGSFFALIGLPPWMQAEMDHRGVAVCAALVSE